MCPDEPGTGSTLARAEASGSRTSSFRPRSAGTAEPGRPSPGAGPGAGEPRRYPGGELAGKPAGVARTPPDRGGKCCDHRSRDPGVVGQSAVPKPGGSEVALAELGILLAANNALTPSEVTAEFERETHLMLELVDERRIIEMSDLDSILGELCREQGRAVKPETGVQPTGAQVGLLADCDPRRV